MSLDPCRTSDVDGRLRFVVAVVIFDGRL